MASPASCKSKCRHASDFKLTAKHDLGTRRCEGKAGRGLPGVGDTSGANAPAVRVLDVGGGSCALDQYFQAYLAPMFPTYRSVVTMSVDVGYSCAYHLICSEKGSLALTGSWYELLPVPHADVVFHTQGLHHIDPAKHTYDGVFDNIARPLRPGGWLHLGDHTNAKNRPWRTALKRWAAQRNYSILRDEPGCDGRHNFLFKKPC